VYAAGQRHLHSLQELPLLRPLREAGRYLQRLQVKTVPASRLTYRRLSSEEIHQGREY